MRKKFRYCLAIAAIVSTCGILAVCLGGVIPDGGTQETKASIPLEDFWKTEDSESAGVLKFSTGLEIVLPDEWVGKVVLNTNLGPEHDPICNTLTLSEKLNNEESQCGDLFYLELYEYEKGYISYTVSTVLGLYKQGDTEYVLSYLEPRDLQYVEGDAEKKRAYEELFFLIDEVRIVTENMEGFTPCTIDDLEWLRDEGELD